MGCEAGTMTASWKEDNGAA